jgi:orotate phosphoribosyltransferase
VTKLETQLLTLLKERSFCYKPGGFRLASGDVSDYYIDARTSAVFSEAAWLIGECIFERTKDLDIQAIGGLEVGAVPLTTAAVISYHLHGRKIEGFWVRNQAKSHGTKKLIEGNLKPGSRVVIVDDVFTKGASALKAATEVRAHGCEVALVLAVVDRLQGARELFRQAQIAEYQAIFTIQDFGVPASASTDTLPIY